MKNVLIALIAILPNMAWAQSALTIFSEDGDKFYLVLNGQKQNSIPQANVRIDGLAQPYYNAKIVFEDGSKPEISKNIPVTDPQTNAPVDVTYKIKHTKDGELKIRYFSAVPVQPNYVAPPDVYVMHYGQVPPPPPSGTVTQTTVTTTTTNTATPPPPPVGANISVNGGGVNMNINVSDPNMNVNVNGGSTTQTTTTRTTSYSTTTADNYNQPQPQQTQPARTGCQWPMDMGSFNSAKQTISKSSFEDTKLSTAKTILASNCVNTDQVIQICKLFTFEASKLDFAKFAYSKTTDPGNYFKVGNVFDFDASRTDLNSYISGQ